MGCTDFYVSYFINKPQRLELDATNHSGCILLLVSDNKKCCTYVHPSASILKVALFTKTEGEIKIKGWEESKPFGYPSEDIVGDYIKANITLLALLERIRVMKEYNVMQYQKIQKGEDIPEEMAKGITTVSKREAMKMVDLLRHKAK